jgi:hypothetical protein
MKRFALTLLGMTVACSGPAASSPDDASIDAAPEASLYAAECANAAVPPATIDCTGLYADVATKQLATGVRPYAPAVPLWADTASKNRWISLPPGTQIDATDPNEWIFPVGTKVWKEFSRDGRRVETRFFEKTQPGYWVRTTYAWTDDETEATSSAGGDIPLGTDGGTYHIPTPDECDQCHRGRTDHLLGFEQVSLGLAAATGLTLPELVAEQLVTPPPARTSLMVGDDGTGVAAAPLAWLHINCGVSCHNANSNSTAYGSGMLLRLDPTLLDGRSSVDFDSRTTTIGQLANNPMWSGQTRIVPGDPSHSLLVKLITNRGTDNPVANQMPPIASSLVDTTDTQAVIDWIGKMPAAPMDAGSDAESRDAMASDAGHDAGGPDAEASKDASTTGPDATLGDTGVDAASEDSASEGAAGDDAAGE